MKIIQKASERLPEGADLILLGEYGSTSHGVSTEDSDFDFIGVAVEPFSAVFGLESYEHTVLKDVAASEATAAGDEEGTIYALKKFLKLAEDGNTAIMSALYLPKYEVLTEAGEMLVNARGLFRSKRVLRRFASHLENERRRMVGELGAKVLRPQLVEKFGFDTKAAYQATKLAFHASRFAEVGELSIPFPENEIATILSIRSGEMKREEVNELLVEARTRIDNEAENSTTLPDRPDREKINELCAKIYRKVYKEV